MSMETTEGYLYVGYDGTGHYKIGITKHPVKRMKQIRTGNPTFVYLWCFSYENPQVKELEYHTKFASQQISGEWYALLPADLQYICEQYATANGIKVDSDFSGFFSTWHSISHEKVALQKEHVKDALASWAWMHDD